MWYQAMAHSSDSLASVLHMSVVNVPVLVPVVPVLLVPDSGLVQLQMLSWVPVRVISASVTRASSDVA